MAQTFLATQVSDICVGKPSLRSLPSTASIVEAVAELKKSGELYVSVWECDHHNNEGIVYCRCLGKICMVDVIVFLCEKENILCPLEALKTSVVDLVMNMDGRIRHLEPDSSLLEAIDCILEGAQNLVIPLQTTTRSDQRKKQLIKSLLR
uniref:Uncharacterized protein n=1 Tax=Tanacetum cinerariifolium TaxID=118510 RepID=A0A6L2MZS9_TANCI|nr:hypothetical protein [Tanacetum cinerariifolium]